ncbi:DeoR/GlpR transcriptional regulator, partial [Lactobacillus delbrueckii subsp. bulgaricus]|nr:DeoR/GlpR transcriptional regulator [Lactobacillus delbrueckii subsp. bulgaricus]
CLLGGHVKRQTHAAIGATTVSRLQELNFNAAFIGANALSPAGFLTTPDTEEAAVKRTAIQQSQQAFVLIDRSKFNAVTFAEFAKTDQVTIISRLEAGDREKLPVNIQLEEAE